jgi:hypothetical protein
MKLSVAPISRSCRPWIAGWRGGGIGRNHRTVSLRDKTKRLKSLESSPPGHSWSGKTWTQFLAPRGLDPCFRGCRNSRFAGMGQHGGCRRRDNMGFPTMGQPGVRLRSPTKGCPYDKRNTNAHRHHNPAASALRQPSHGRRPWEPWARQADAQFLTQSPIQPRPLVPFCWGAGG